MVLYCIVYKLPGSLGQHSNLIGDMDGRVQSRETSIRPEEVNVYRAAIRLTEKEILRQAQIILCTCSVSVMSKIQQSTNIYQASQLSSS